METHMENNKMLYSHVSVDCVLLGVNEDKLCVLLIERQMDNSDEKRYKLPGSLIFENEDLDTAAHRVFNEATGLKRVPLKQFRSFGSPSRTKNKDDMQWLENAMKLKIERIVTVAYLALSRTRPINIIHWPGFLSMHCLLCRSTIKKSSRPLWRKYVSGLKRNHPSFSITCL